MLVYSDERAYATVIEIDAGGEGETMRNSPPFPANAGLSAGEIRIDGRRGAQAALPKERSDTVPTNSPNQAAKARAA
jgi:hypothetical protein